MGGELLIGLDVGTTRVSALVVDGTGSVRGRAGRALECSFPAAGWVEQDPSSLWESSLAVLREVLAEAGATARDVAALGLATQRSTSLAWDAQSGEALAPAIGWQDQRTAARAAELQAHGVPMPAQASATKLEWLLQNQRAGGKWFTRSPAKDSRHYFSNFGSAFAILAFLTGNLFDMP